METNKKEKPRFHDAQPGDLLWNDERGICEVTKHFCNDPKFPKLGIKFSCGNGYECITFEGKACISSPKATFFFYSEEDHYLTERPEAKVDWTKIEEGTEIEVQCPNELWVAKRFFYAYTPDKVFPIITMELSGWNRLERWGKARLMNG